MQFVECWLSLAALPSHTAVAHTSEEIIYPAVSLDFSNISSKYMHQILLANSTSSKTTVHNSPAKQKEHSEQERAHCSKT